jgi:hypothetical protein
VTPQATGDISSHTACKPVAISNNRHFNQAPGKRANAIRACESVVVFDLPDAFVEASFAFEQSEKV